ncbi:phage gp6-like head-tail connector protein [Paraburkholderia sp. Tr-20389]|uniref:head-tail connector protein n=1 Tax=Paraburkholderia sp. Tr-20389 TaxID=2703903 RepID=UPI001980C57C|nr:head-tail connector protein [Paraburkholderia sp. Tr-20389]MBN3756064.1 phage gp6-like head-tail connector protein [Paraburkholderia sp. Tr-20389]
MSTSRSYEIVTIDQAKVWLRVDGTAMDADIELAIAGATASVYAYLKRPEPYSESDPAPANVVQAIVLLAGMFIRDPDIADASSWQAGYPPSPVVSILYPLRDPAIS